MSGVQARHWTYMGTSLIRKFHFLGPYRTPMSGVLGGWAFSYERGTGATRNSGHTLSYDPSVGLLGPFYGRCVSIFASSSCTPVLSCDHPFEDYPFAGSAAIFCTGGPGVIQKEAWPFYKTIPGVRVCWELEEPEGPKGSGQDTDRARCRLRVSGLDRGTSIIRNCTPLGPYSSTVPRALR